MYAYDLGIYFQWRGYWCSVAVQKPGTTYCTPQFFPDGYLLYHFSTDGILVIHIILTDSQEGSK